MRFVLKYHIIFNLSTIIHKKMKNKPLPCANRIEVQNKQSVKYTSTQQTDCITLCLKLQAGYFYALF